MLEILKKVKINKVDYAWVTVDATHAELIVMDKNDLLTLAKADNIKLKNDELKAKKTRLEVVQSEIQRLKEHGITIR